MSQSAKRIALVFGSVLLLLGGGLWLFWPKPLPPPDETRRVTHPAGFSMIVPAGFEGSMNTVGDATFSGWIHCLDPNYSAGNPTLGVRRFRSEPDREALSNEGYKLTGTFQGHDVIILNGPKGRGTLAQWNWRMVVKIDDSWFDLYATDLQYFDYSKHKYKEYLETFRYAPKSTSAPQPVPAATTTPTTAPTTTPATSGS